MSHRKTAKMCSEILLFIAKGRIQILRSFSRDSTTILKTAVDSTLSYSCHCIFLSKLHLKGLDKLQANLIRVVLGLSKYCHIRHLMQAIRIKPISHRSTKSLDLLRTCILSNSKTKALLPFVVE